MPKVILQSVFKMFSIHIQEEWIEECRVESEGPRVRARQTVASLVVSQELSVVKDSDCPRQVVAAFFILSGVLEVNVGI